MCEFNPKNDGRRIDLCMRKLISSLNALGIKTLACCCGHGKYPMSLVVDVGVLKKVPVELFSDTALDNKKKFYRKDKKGHYYIPEVMYNQ